MTDLGDGDHGEAFAPYEGDRLTYDRDDLVESDAPEEPFALLRRWLDAAEAAGVVEPTAMVVATAAADGSPRSRTVLLRRLTKRALFFFTNRDSDKGAELATGRCALQLGWLDLQRQIRVTGVVRPCDDRISDDYFAGRPRGSQIAAWASPQSRVLSGRAELEELVAECEARFEGAPVPRPPFWGGYEVEPLTVEFWQGRPSRLHDRLRFRRDDVGSSTWVRERLAP